MNMTGYLCYSGTGPGMDAEHHGTIAGVVEFCAHVLAHGASAKVIRVRDGLTVNAYGRDDLDDVVAALIAG